MGYSDRNRNGWRRDAKGSVHAHLACRRPDAGEPLLRLHARHAVSGKRAIRWADPQRDQHAARRRREHPDHPDLEQRCADRRGRLRSRSRSGRIVHRHPHADPWDNQRPGQGRADHERLRRQLHASAEGQPRARPEGRDALFHIPADAGVEQAGEGLRGVGPVVRLGAVPDLAEPLLRALLHRRRLRQQRADPRAVRHAHRVQPDRRPEESRHRLAHLPSRHPAIGHAVAPVGRCVHPFQAVQRVPDRCGAEHPAQLQLHRAALFPRPDTDPAGQRRAPAAQRRLCRAADRAGLQRAAGRPRLDRDAVRHHLRRAWRLLRPCAAAAGRLARHQLSGRVRFRLLRRARAGGDHLALRQGGQRDPAPRHHAVRSHQHQRDAACAVRHGVPDRSATRPRRICCPR